MVVKRIILICILCIGPIACEQVPTKTIQSKPHICQLKELAGKHDIVVHQVGCQGGAGEIFAVYGCILIDVYSIASINEADVSGLGTIIQLRRGITFIYVEESVVDISMSIKEIKDRGYHDFK